MVHVMMTLIMKTYSYSYLLTTLTVHRLKALRTVWCHLILSTSCMWNGGNSWENYIMQSSAQFSSNFYSFLAGMFLSLLLVAYTEKPSGSPVPQLRNLEIIILLNKEGTWKLENQQLLRCTREVRSQGKLWEPQLEKQVHEENCSLESGNLLGGQHQSRNSWAATDRWRKVQRMNVNHGRALSCSCELLPRAWPDSHSEQSPHVSSSRMRKRSHSEMPWALPS